jgi:hypothetical protein
MTLRCAREVTGRRRRVNGGRGVEQQGRVVSRTAQRPALHRAARGSRACDGQWRDDGEGPGRDPVASARARCCWQLAMEAGVRGS